MTAFSIVKYFQCVRFFMRGGSFPGADQIGLERIAERLPMSSQRRPRGRPKGFDNDPEAVVNKSIDRAIDVLEALRSGGAMSLSEIAAATDQSAATIYRILTTFLRRDMVETDADTQQWSLGAGAFRLGSAFLRRTDVVERARPEMRRLMEETGETSNLGIDRGDMVMFISQIETHETIRAFFPPGTLSPLHASGIGKALLSRFPADRIARFVAKGPLARFTPGTITDPGRLRHELDHIRAQGFAFDDEETTEGMRCIAAPILNLHGEAVAGISISGPSHRVTLDRVEPVGALVRAAAANISRGLGALA